MCQYRSIRLILAVMLIVASRVVVLAQSDQDTLDKVEQTVTAADAVSKVYTYTGFDVLKAVPPQAASEMAQLATIDSDDTPFLGAGNTGRQIWKVKMEDVTLDLKEWTRSAVVNQIPKDYEFWVDAVSGQVLKVTAKQKGAQLDMRPEPSADAATSSLRFRGEVYEGYPATPPPVTFEVACDEAMLSHPLRAKELIAVCVMWSYRGSPTKPVWCITGRGVPKAKRRPEEPRDGGRMRCIIDATTGALMKASTSPRLR